MSARERQLRELLVGYRDRAEAIKLEMPELAAIIARHGAGGAAVAERPAPAAERPAPAAPRPVPPAPRPAPAAKRPPAHVPPPSPPRPPASRPAANVEAPARGPGYARAAWLAAALGAVLAGGGWAYNARLQKQNINRILSLPMSSSVGLARRGAVLYSFDRTHSMLGAVDTATGGLISLKRFPNGLARGLAVSPEKLWSADASGFLYEHSLKDDYAVLRTFANPDRRPCALHWDGSRLWIADARTNSIYEYTVGASLVPARQFTLPLGMKPVGLHVEKGLVWVLDAASRTVYRYRVRALLEPVDSMSLQPWISAPRQPTGMAIDDQALWISVDGTPLLHRFDLRLLPWRSES